MKDPHDTRTLELPLGQHTHGFDVHDLDDTLAREEGFDLGPAAPPPAEPDDELAAELEVEKP